jgi:hypothetical protein
MVHAGVHARLQVEQVTWDLRMLPAALGAAASRAEPFLLAPGSLAQVLDLLPLLVLDLRAPDAACSTVEADTGQLIEPCHCSG